MQDHVYFLEDNYVPLEIVGSGAYGCVI